MPIVVKMLTGNHTITKLDLEDCQIADGGCTYLMERIHRTNLQELDLSTNSITDRGGAAVCKALSHPSRAGGCLRIAKNRLGDTMIRNVIAALKVRGSYLNIDFHGNFMLSEIWNAITHGLGWLFHFSAMAYMYTNFRKFLLTPSYAAFSVHIYCTSLLFMFLASCIYHALFFCSKASKVFQILDHTAIYCLIAGSYTPILMIVGSVYDAKTKRLRYDTTSSALVAVYWSLALFGILFYCSLGFTYETTKKWLESPTQFVTVVELVMYAVMGGGAMWYPIFFKLKNFMKSGLQGIKTQAEIAALKTRWIWYILSGGISYLGGIVFFVLGNTQPMMHVIWHLAVMLGAGFHFKAVYDLVWVCHVRQQRVAEEADDLIL